MTAEDTLVPELRRALARLNDPLFLETLPLTDMLVRNDGDDSVAKGALLRRLMLEAIDALAPEHGRTGGDVRTYDILYRYAIARESMTAIAQQLGLSERHAYRELHQAIDALAVVLQRLSAEAGPPVEEDSGSAEATEDLARLLEMGPQHVDVGELLADAALAVSALADQQRVAVTLTCVDMDRKATVHRALMRQAMVSLLSHAIWSASPEQGVGIGLTADEETATIRLHYRERERLDAADGPYAAAVRALSLMDVAWHKEQDQACGTVDIRIELPLEGEHTLVIIDDNADLIALFRRYLRGAPYRVIGFDQVEEGLQALDSLDPEILILDIAMPHLDGWEVLQELAATERPKRTRTVVCSIINDPHLAAALGADAFLNKPVTRPQLLSTLEEVLKGPA